MEVVPRLPTFSPEVRCFLWVLVFVDANHHQSFGGSFLVKLFEGWQGSYAGCAPGGPKSSSTVFPENDLSATVAPSSDRSSTIGTGFPTKPWRRTIRGSESKSLTNAAFNGGLSVKSWFGTETTSKSAALNRTVLSLT